MNLIPVIKLCKENNCQQPTLSLWTNGAKIGRIVFSTMLSEASIANRCGAYTRKTVVLPEYQGAITTLPGFHEGLFHSEGEIVSFIYEHRVIKKILAHLGLSEEKKPKRKKSCNIDLKKIHLQA